MTGWYEDGNVGSIPGLSMGSRMDGFHQVGKCPENQLELKTFSVVSFKWWGEVGEEFIWYMILSWSFLGVRMVAASSVSFVVSGWMSSWLPGEVMASLVTTFKSGGGQRDVGVQFWFGDW